MDLDHPKSEIKTFQISEDLNVWSDLPIGRNYAESTQLVERRRFRMVSTSEVILNYKTKITKQKFDLRMDIINYKTKIWSTF